MKDLRNYLLLDLWNISGESFQKIKRAYVFY